jgi:hypothetical protein
MRVAMPDGIVYSLRRHRLEGGERTTIYVVRYPLRGIRVTVWLFRQPRRLDFWCAKHGHKEAVVGGFYLRNPYRPLGELWRAGRQLVCEPFDSPHDVHRAALVDEGEDIRIAPRSALPETPNGDLLQAGPLLVADGQMVFDRSADREGFSAGAAQFDSDITDGRHPRAALGISENHLYVAVCDGRRSGVDAGLSLEELGKFMVTLDCREAMNLDGGGSATLVHRGHLLNRPYSEQDQPAPASRPIVSALTFNGR